MRFRMMMLKLIDLSRVDWSTGDERYLYMSSRTTAGLEPDEVNDK